MSYLAPANRSQSLAGLAVVIVFHIILIYALVNGLARKIVEVVKPPLMAKLIEDIKAPPPEKAPPPPPPKLAPPPPAYIPPPEVVIQMPTPAPSISVTTDVKPAEIPPPRPVPMRTNAVIDPKTACAKPEYPPAALRAEQSGVVILSFLIGVDGRVIESKVDRTSGYRLLDEAARRALSRCKFIPATSGGQPAQAWGKLEYEWRIE